MPSNTAEDDGGVDRRDCYACGSLADLRFDRDRWLCPDCWESHTHTGGTPETAAKTAEESRQRLARCSDGE